MRETIDQLSDPYSWTQSPIGIGLLFGLIATAAGIMMAFGGPIISAGVIVAIIAALIILRDIEIGFWGVIGVICLLPFATLPFKIVITPTFLDLALGAVFGVWLLRLVTGRQNEIITSPVTIPLLVFVLVAIFAFVFGMSNGPLTSQLLRKFAELILSLSFVILIIDYCRTWYKLERLVRAFILFGTAAAAIGIGFWLLPDEIANDILNVLSRLGYPGGFVIRYIEENPELSERAIGTSVDPNVYGGLLVLIGAVTAPQLLSKKPNWPRWFVYVLFGIISLALLLTFSRGAFVALIAAVGFIALVRYRQYIPALALTGIILLAVALTIGLGEAYIDRLLAGFRGEDLATQMRFGEYRDALSLVQRYPLFGVGFAGSPDVDLYLGVAMVYLTIGQQMGFLGLLAFVAVMVTVFGYAFINRHDFKTQPEKDAVWLGLHGAVFGGLIAGVFDHYLFNLEFLHAVTAYWMLLGLAVAATRLGSQPAEIDPPASKPNKEGYNA
ncbi:MAG: O-antigen ligase family protein [Ardenticatenaceae bacterium]|nr:O-antigen ligase family protein [Ardenticatenaceae bacterium]